MSDEKRANLLDELSETWQSVERAIWPLGPAHGTGSGVYAGLKARIIAALAPSEPAPDLLEASGGEPERYLAMEREMQVEAAWEALMRNVLEWYRGEGDDRLDVLFDRHRPRIEAAVIRALTDGEPR